MPPDAAALRYRCRSANVIHEMFDDELVVVDLESGVYYAVNPVGAAVWMQVIAHRTAGELTEALAARYAGDGAEIAGAVRKFLDELLASGLIVADDGASALNGAVGSAGVVSAAGDRSPFVAPELEPYTDMQDLMLLDPIHQVDESGWPRSKKPTSAG